MSQKRFIIEYELDYSKKNELTSLSRPQSRPQSRPTSSLGRASLSTPPKERPKTASDLESNKPPTKSMKEPLLPMKKDNFFLQNEGSLSQNSSTNKVDSIDTDSIMRNRLKLTPLERQQTSGVYYRTPVEQDFEIKKKIRQFKESNSHQQNKLSSLISKLDEMQSKPLTGSDYLKESLKYAKPIDNEIPLTNSATESFKTAHRGFVRDIQNYRDKIVTPLNHDSGWDSQFIYANTLSPKKRPKTADIHDKHSKFVSSMEKFNHSLSRDASSNRLGTPNKGRPITPKKKNSSSPSRGHSATRSRPQSRQSRNSSRPSSPSRPMSPYFPFESNNNSSLQSSQVFDMDGPDPFSVTANSQFNQTSNMLAEDPGSWAIEPSSAESISPDIVILNEHIPFYENLWKQLIYKLHRCGEDILYSDLNEISSLREPPTVVIHVIGFIAILLGLIPVWKTIRGTLLKESLIFQNFVREVNKIK